MNAHGVELLFASVASLAAGPLVSGAARGLGAWGFWLRSLFAAAMVAVLALLVLPELCAEIGVAALPLVAVGAAAPALAERVLRRSRRAGHAVSLGLVLAALAVHAFCDGLVVHGLHSGSENMHGEALALGAVLHRLPEGVALWWLVRSRGIGFASAAFAGLSLALVLGFAFASTVVLAGAVSAWLEALVAGVVLHVVLHHWPARQARPQTETVHAAS
jgi:hypothetical protein